MGSSMENALVLNDEQRALQDTAAAFVAEFGNARKPPAEDGALWQRMVDMGWAAVHVPEAFDGLGMGAVELCLLMEEMGRQLLRSPFLPTVVLAQTLLIEGARAEAQAVWLPRLMAGEAATVIATPALHGALGALPIVARADGEDWLLEGEAAQVFDCGLAAVAFVVARLATGGVGLFAVPAAAAGVSRRALEVWDGSRAQARWRFDAVRLAGSARLDAGGSAGGNTEGVSAEGGALEAALARSLRLAALTLAAEQVGGAARCLELTVAYTGERVQFGRPIAGFQAVKHRCAQMMVRLETARSAVRGVAARLAGLAAGEAERQVAVARVLATEAYRFCAQEAIQLHGGVGFTWEYDPQLHFKRAQSASHWFGGVEAWRERVAANLLDVA